MKIVRHTARDMRSALRAVREQLGEEAVILSSRRTSAGVEVTAAVDFDAATLEAGGFANTPALGATAAPGATSTPSTAVAPSAAAVSSSAFAPAATTARTTAPVPAAIAHTHAATHVSTMNVAPAAAAAQVAPAHASLTQTVPTLVAPTQVMTGTSARTDVPVFRSDDVVSHAQSVALSPLGSPDDATAAKPTLVSDAMGNELKTLRRMLETQLAQLAWNDLARRAPIHTEILRELTEIGITQDLVDVLLKQLPHDVDLTFARRFAIAGLSQYLRVTPDRWLDEGGRVAFIGATGVGKTTTLAKIAVRWVLRHGARDLALVAADSARIGSQDQLQSFAQLLGVPVYVPDRFESVPALVSRLSERLVLIDTPGSSLRDAQLPARLAVLSSSASRLETALVLAASTQAGAVEEAVKRFAPANPASCVLTKLDEAVSLGGLLSALIRARMPVSYVSDGQRVPEDLRPARALELVSEAVRLAKASGAAADEDLLRRRIGKTAHALT